MTYNAPRALPPFALPHLSEALTPTRPSHARSSSASSSASHDDVSTGRSRISKACEYCRKRKVRCDGLSRCANCTRVKRECLYLPVDDATNQATKERKSHLKNLKALGYIVPRGGAAIKAVKAGKLAAANLLNITAPCKAPPVLNLAFLPPPPTKRVNTASQENKSLPFPSVLRRCASSSGSYEGDQSLHPHAFGPAHASLASSSPIPDDPTAESSQWTSIQPYSVRSSSTSYTLSPISTPQSLIAVTPTRKVPEMPVSYAMTASTSQSSSAGSSVWGGASSSSYTGSTPNTPVTTYFPTYFPAPYSNAMTGGDEISGQLVEPIICSPTTSSLSPSQPPPSYLKGSEWQFQTPSTASMPATIADPVQFARYHPLPSATSVPCATPSPFQPISGGVEMERSSSTYSIASTPYLTSSTSSKFSTISLDVADDDAMDAPLLGLGFSVSPIPTIGGEDDSSYDPFFVSSRGGFFSTTYPLGWGSQEAVEAPGTFERGTTSFVAWGEQD